MVATEIAHLPLKEAPNFDDATTDFAKATATLASLIEKQPGFIRTRSGAVVERPTELQVFVDWENVSDHIAFTQSSDYAQVGASMGTILSGAPSYKHYHFVSAKELELALSAPVTENVTMYFRSQDEGMNDRLEKFGKVAKQAKGAQGFAYGWSEEEVEHEKLGEGVKGEALRLCIGWGKVEEHMAFRETEVFKENIGLLREGPVGSEMVHVAVRQQ